MSSLLGLFRYSLTGAVILLTGCTNLAEHKTPYEPDQKNFTDLARAATQFEKRQTEAAASAAAIPAYLDAGVTLSNVACERWFTSLARAERDTSLTKDLMNVVGNLILGVAGINGANANSIGRGALGLAAANTAFEVYQSNVLLGSIEDIRAKIREDRTVAEDALLGRTDVTFDAAQRRLLEYHKLCSAERIKVLLSTSLSAVKFEHPDTTLSGPVDRAQARVLVTTLKLGNVDALLQSQDLLYQTYLALVAYPTPDGSEPDVAKAARNNQVVAIYASKYVNAADKEEVLTTLQQIAVLLKFGDRLKSDIAAGAAQKQADAKKDLEDAKERVNATVKSSSGDREVANALGISSDGGTEAATVRVDPYDQNLQQRLATSSSNNARNLALELQKVRDAETRLKLAAGSADRARSSLAPAGGVTPRIVPVGR